MFYIINKNKSLIIGIVLFLMLILLIPRNINLFPTKKISTISTPKYNINHNISNTEYKDEKENILFQIKALKCAITQNISLYNAYKKIFSYNLNYSNSIKKILKNKIYIANLSIDNEIKILYKIKYIVNIHHYSYSKLLEINNYSIPKILLCTTKKKLVTKNSIKEYSAKLNKTCDNINNISYQSEEELIGFCGITSTISSSKSLFISKINLNYNYILCFSNYLGKLINFNKFVNKNIIVNNRHLITKNQFISKSNIHLKIKSNNKKSYFSSNTEKIKNISHKTWIIAIPATTLVLIMAVLKMLRHKKRPYPEQDRIETIQRETQIPRIDNNENPVLINELSKSNNEDNEILPVISQEYDYLMHDIVTFSHDEPLTSYNSKLSTTDSATKLTKDVPNVSFPLLHNEHLGEDHSTLYLQRNYEQMQDNHGLISGSNNYSQLVEPILFPSYSNGDEKVQRNDLYLFSNPNVASCSSNYHSQLSSFDEFNTSDQDNLIEHIMNDEVSYVPTSDIPGNYPVSDIVDEWEKNFNTSVRVTNKKDHGEETFMPTQNQESKPGEATYKQNRTLSTMTGASCVLDDKMFISTVDINFLFSLDPTQWDYFFRKLYKLKIPYSNILYNCFNTRITNFLYQRRFSYLLNERPPNIARALLHIKNILIRERKKLKKMNTNYDQYPSDYDALIRFTSSKEAKKRNYRIISTNNGWFEHPSFQHREKFITWELTKEKYDYILQQHRRFDRIKSIISELADAPEHNKRVSEYLLSRAQSVEPENTHTVFLKSMSEEIYADMKELIDKYESFSDISEVNVETLSEKIDPPEVVRRWKEKFNFVWKFQNSKLIREDYGLHQTGINEYQLLNEIKKYREKIIIK